MNVTSVGYKRMSQRRPNIYNLSLTIYISPLQLSTPPITTMSRIALSLLCLVAAAMASQNCYNCKSGGINEDQLAGCPADGVLSGWAATNFVECENPCATVVKA